MQRADSPTVALATSTYNLVVYAFAADLSVSLTDATGTASESTGTFALELPGDEGREYVRFDGLKPFDLGGGGVGVRVATNTAVRMAGLQLVEVPEPSGLTMAGVGLGAVVVCLGWRRQRATP